VIVRRPPASLLLLAYGALVLIGCSPLGAADRPDICTYVRAAVSAGDFPISLAALQYPECKAVSRK
jgi:hypothetical protein